MGDSAMAIEDRRQQLRRLDDIRALLQFCHSFNQAVPRKLVLRLEEAGLRAPVGQPIPELLLELDAIERPLLEALAEERRKRPRRWINAELVEDAGFEL